jgi:hypothetical protein
VFKAAVEVLRLLSRCRGRFPGVRGCRRGVEVKWLSRLSDCELRALRLNTDIFYLLFKEIHRNTDYWNPQLNANSAVPSELLIQQNCLLNFIYCSRKYIAIQIIKTLNQMQTPLYPVNS